MLFKKVRKLFSHREDRDYDSDRQRDAYMDVLREMQSPRKPPEAKKRRAVEASVRASAQIGRGVPE